MTSQTTPPRPLSGLRILDLTQGIAGPYATRLLAAYGATVIKLERPPVGDPCRRWRPFCGEDEPHGALFSFLNADKASIVIDLKRPEGREALLCLVTNFDAVIESFQPGVMDRLGLSYETLSRSRPGLVVTSISNFGQTGAFRDFEATDLTIFALAGRMAATGTRPRPPVRLLGGASLFFAGTIAAGATLIALRGRKNDGMGDHLDISIANGLLGSPDRALCLFSYSGINVERPDGPRPYQVFPAADGFVVIAVNRGLDRIAEMIGKPEIAADPRFASNLSRQEHAGDLEPIIIEWTVTRTKSEIIAEAGKHRVVAAPVATMAEVLANDHLHARRFFRSVPGATCRCQSIQPGPPFRIHTADHLGWALESGAPPLGRDTRGILMGIAGLTKSEVDNLAAESVIIDKPEEHKRHIGRVL